MSITEKNVIILGNTYCGKSFLIWKFTNHKTCEVPTVTIEKYNKEIVVNERRFSLNLLDTTSAQIYPRFMEEIFRSTNFSSADMILLCFDISNSDSFQDVHNFWIPEIERHSISKKIPYILVGLKKDLRQRAESNKERVPVTKEEGERMAETISALGYVECAAKYDDGVQEVFETVARQFVREDVKPPKGFLRKLFGL